MSYSKNTWASGDLVTAAKLNNVETGLEAVDTAVASKAAVSVSATGSATEVVNYITVDGVEKKLPAAGAGTTVEANPVLQGQEARLQSIKINNTTYDIDKGLKGITVSVMGDSISTYANWTPNSENGNRHVWRPLADGTSVDTGYVDNVTLQHDTYYPNGYITSVTQQYWWKLIFEELGARLGVVEAWSGSFIGNNKDSNSNTTTSSNSNDTGPDTCMASNTRIKRLGANGDPDIILYYGGTNDLAQPGTPGETLPTSGNSATLFNSTTDYYAVDTTTTKWAYFIDAFRTSIQRMQYYYPKAKIVVLLPTYCASYYNRAKLDLCCTEMKKVCDYFGVNYIDLRACGISPANIVASNNAQGIQTLGDANIHPNPTGMEMIAKYIKRKLLTILDDKFDARTVHDVVNSAYASGYTLDKPYIIGVTNGRPYNVTVSGSSLPSIKVYMNEQDITSTCYNSSTGAISINSVTGPIEISVGAPTVVSVTGVSLNKNTVSLNKNDIETLTATIAPANASNKNLTWSVAGATSETTTTWYTSNASASRVNSAKATYASFFYQTQSKGAEGDGSSMNRVRFGVKLAGTITVGKLSADGATIVDSETLTCTAAAGTIAELATTKTFTLENGEHFFVMIPSDTAMFAYTETAGSNLGGFYYKAGGSSWNINNSSTTCNLGVDFGYTTASSPVLSIAPNGATCNVTALANGTDTVTVTTEDGSFTASCVVTVTGQNNLTDIEITTPPSKTKYAVGEAFDATGMVVTASYDDSTTDTIVAGEYSVSPSTIFDTAGEKTITVSWTYNGTTKTDTTTITVYALDGISITTVPTKITYGVGESFSNAGMVVAGSYGAAGSRTVTGYTWSPDTALTLTDTTITISYGGFTCTQAITVIESVPDTWYFTEPTTLVSDATIKETSINTVGPFFYRGNDFGFSTTPDVNALLFDKKVNLIKVKVAKAGVWHTAIWDYPDNLTATPVGQIGSTVLPATKRLDRTRMTVTFTSDMVGTWQTIELPWTVYVKSSQWMNLGGESDDTGFFNYAEGSESTTTAFGYGMYNHLTQAKAIITFPAYIAINLGYRASADNSYNIAVNVANCTYTSDVVINPDQTAIVTLTPNASYSLPASLVVNGADYTYDNTTGVITLTNATGNVTIEDDPTIWHTAHYSQGSRGNSANATGYAGFCYKDSYKGTEGDGASMNKVRFYLDTAGTLTVGKASSDMKTVVDSEVVNVTGNKGELKIVPLTKTYTLENGEHFFCLTKTDTMKFEYCWNNPYPQASDYAEFWCHVGYSTAGTALGGSQNLNFDFGYDSTL